MSYNAIIATLTRVRKFEGADRLQLASCMGDQVVVSLDAKEDDVVVYYPSDGQLSHENVYNNNQYNKPELNLNPAEKGYFCSKRRVRCQTFRGQKSEAYVAAISSLKFTGYDLKKLSIGDAFCELNGVPVANKYITPATIRAAKGGTPKTQSGYNKAIMKKLFPEHFETVQMRHANDNEFLGLITLNRKIHGSSGRSSHIKVPVEIPINYFKNIWNVFVEEIFEGPKHIFNFFLSQDQKNALRFYPKVKWEWQKIYGTRRVCKGMASQQDDDFRTYVHKKIEPFLNKNEIFYYEIVGFENTGASIMQSVATDQMKPFLSKDEFKDFKKKFGDNMIYKYGCLPNTCEIYVYRIAVINEDGVMYDLPWSVVKERCINAGIKHVQEIEQHFITDVSQVPALRERIEFLTDGDDIHEPIDNSHIREGICVRVEHNNGKTLIRKNKCFIFKILEGLVKDSGVVDMEEAEGDFVLDN